MPKSEPNIPDDNGVDATTDPIDEELINGDGVASACFVIFATCVSTSSTILAFNSASAAASLASCVAAMRLSRALEYVDSIATIDRDVLFVARIDAGEDNIVESATEST